MSNLIISNSDEKCHECGSEMYTVDDEPDAKGTFVRMPKAVCKNENCKTREEKAELNWRVLSVMPMKPMKLKINNSCS